MQTYNLTAVTLNINKSQCSAIYNVECLVSSGYEALIGELCEMDRNCLTKQMVCNPDKTCDCMKGHYPSDDRRGCIASKFSVH